MKKLTHRQQLRLIEGLCLIWEDSIQTVEGAKTVMGYVYKFAHLNLTCTGKHLDWHAEGFKMGKTLKKQKITDINR